MNRFPLLKGQSGVSRPSCFWGAPSQTLSSKWQWKPRKKIVSLFCFLKQRISFRASPELQPSLPRTPECLVFPIDIKEDLWAEFSRPGTQVAPSGPISCVTSHPSQLSPAKELEVGWERDRQGLAVPWRRSPTSPVTGREKYLPLGEPLFQVRHRAKRFSEILSFQDPNGSARPLGSTLPVENL